MSTEWGKLVYSVIRYDCWLIQIWYNMMRSRQHWRRQNNRRLLEKLENTLTKPDIIGIVFLRSYPLNTTINQWKHLKRSKHLHPQHRQQQWWLEPSQEQSRHHPAVDGDDDTGKCFRNNEPQKIKITTNVQREDFSWDRSFSSPTEYYHKRTHKQTNTSVIHGRQKCNVMAANAFTLLMPLKLVGRIPLNNLNTTAE